MPTVLDEVIRLGHLPRTRDMLEAFCRGELPGAIEPPDKFELPDDWLARQGLGLRQFNNPGWWQYPAIVNRVLLQQAAIRSAFRTLSYEMGCAERDMQYLFEKWTKKKQRFEAQVLYLRRLNQQVDEKLHELLAATKTGATIMAHAGDIERLRKALFTPEFIAETLRREHATERRKRRLRKTFEYVVTHRPRPKFKTKLHSKQKRAAREKAAQEAVAHVG